MERTQKIEANLSPLAVATVLNMAIIFLHFSSLLSHLEGIIFFPMMDINPVKNSSKTEKNIRDDCCLKFRMQATEVQKNKNFYSPIYGSCTMEVFTNNF